MTRSSTALYRKHLTGSLICALGLTAPGKSWRSRSSSMPERAYHLYPSAFLKVKVDGLDSSYFEWLGAACIRRSEEAARCTGGFFF